MEEISFFTALQWWEKVGACLPEFPRVIVADGTMEE